MIKHLLGVLPILVLSAFQVGAAERTYTADLKPNRNVFPADSSASGVAKLRLSADGKTLHYKVEASGIGLVSQAHLHVGRVAITLEGRHSHLPLERGYGPTIANLLDFIPAGMNSGGMVAEGVLTAADLSGELRNYPLSALADHLERGWVYVNVHIFDERKPGQRLCCPSGVNGTVWPD